MGDEARCACGWCGFHDAPTRLHDDEAAIETLRAMLLDRAADHVNAVRLGWAGPLTERRACLAIALWALL